MTERLKDGNIMYKQNQSHTDIVYTDYYTSGISSPEYDTTILPDALSNILMNKTLIAYNTLTLEQLFDAVIDIYDGE